MAFCSNFFRIKTIVINCSTFEKETHTKYT